MSESTNQPPRAGALAGVRVLDLTEHMAGPFCTMILADMGAEVIKLERPGHGDSSRHMGDGSERNPYFRYINRNKLGITLDFKTVRGRELFVGGHARSDVRREHHQAVVGPRVGEARLGVEACSHRGAALGQRP